VGAFPLALGHSEGTPQPVKIPRYQFNEIKQHFSIVTGVRAPKIVIPEETPPVTVTIPQYPINQSEKTEQYCVQYSSESPVKRPWARDSLVSL